MRGTSAEVNRASEYSACSRKEKRTKYLLAVSVSPPLMRLRYNTLPQDAGKVTHPFSS